MLLSFLVIFSFRRCERNSLFYRHRVSIGAQARCSSAGIQNTTGKHYGIPNWNPHSGIEEGGVGALIRGESGRVGESSISHR